MLFCNYPILKKGDALQMNKLKSPLPKGALYQIWKKISQCFWRGRFVKVVNCFTISQLFLLGKVCGLSFKQIWIPFTQECFEPSLAQWFWRMWKCENFTDRRTDGRTDRRHTIRKAHLNFQLTWPKNKMSQNWIVYTI